MDEIRIGLIGCGGMARTHQPAFRQLTGQARVVATADTDIERARAAADVLGAPKAVTDYREMLDDVDAVLTVLPHHLHHPINKDCLEAGKHVLSEKPLANTEGECLDLIHTAQARNLVLMTAYCMRFHPLTVRMKQLIDERTYGDVFQVSMWTEQFTRYHDGHWALTAANLGGGQFFSHGCHYIDLLLWFLGRPVKGTHMGTNYGTPWMEREGTSHVTIEFENRTLGYHAGTWGARGSRLRYSFHAHCTEGMIEAQFKAGKLFVHTDQGEKLLLDTETGKHVQGELAHFVDCVRNGRRPLTDGPGSLQGLRVIWRLYEAEEKGVIADLRGLGLDEAWDIEGLASLPTPSP